MNESEKDTYIYESPDGGETIYRRKAGEEGRVLVKGSNNIYDKIQNDLESQSEISQLRQHVLNLEKVYTENRQVLDIYLRERDIKRETDREVARNR